MDTKICYACRKEDVPYLASLCPYCKFPFRSGVNADGVAHQPVGAIINKWMTRTIFILTLLLVGVGLLCLNDSFRGWLWPILKGLLPK